MCCGRPRCRRPHQRIIPLKRRRAAIIPKGLLLLLLSLLLVMASRRRGCRPLLLQQMPTRFSRPVMVPFLHLPLPSERGQRGGIPTIMTSRRLPRSLRLLILQPLAPIRLPVASFLVALKVMASTVTVGAVVTECAARCPPQLSPQRHFSTQSPATHLRRMPAPKKQLRSRRWPVVATEQSWGGLAAAAHRSSLLLLAAHRVTVL